VKWRETVGDALWLLIEVFRDLARSPEKDSHLAVNLSQAIEQLERLYTSPTSRAEKMAAFSEMIADELYDRLTDLNTWLRQIANRLQFSFPKENETDWELVKDNMVAAYEDILDAADHVSSLLDDLSWYVVSDEENNDQ